MLSKAFRQCVLHQLYIIHVYQRRYTQIVRGEMKMQDMKKVVNILCEQDEAYQKYITGVQKQIAAILEDLPVEQNEEKIMKILEILDGTQKTCYEDGFYRCSSLIKELILGCD